MNRKTRDKLVFLFERYASNASFHFREMNDSFLCPLCFRIFPRQAISEGLLSLEHVIPKSLGGKLTTITCRRCNTRQGSLLDAQLVNRMHSYDVLAGLAPARGKLIIGSAEVTANIYFPMQSDDPNSRKGWYIEGVPTASRPGHPQLSDEEMETGTTEFKVNVSLRYKDIPSRVALIRSAYLMMFYYFGYAYIKYDLVDPIRDQIANIQKSTDLLNGIIRVKGKLADSNCLAIVRQPEEIQSFVALFRMKTQRDHYAVVALPGFNPDRDLLYHRIPSYSKQDMSYTTFPYKPEFISDSQFSSAPEVLWNIVVEGDRKTH